MYIPRFANGYCSGVGLGLDRYVINRMKGHFHTDKKISLL